MVNLGAMSQAAREVAWKYPQSSSGSARSWGTGSMSSSSCPPAAALALAASSSWILVCRTMYECR